MLVPGFALGDHRTSGHVQGRKKCGGAVADVVVGDTLDVAQTHRQQQRRAQPTSGALQAPPLPAAELVLPLPQLRQLLSQRLLQTRALLQRSFSRPAQRPLHTLLLQALRGLLSNLAYGLAFAACAFGRRQQRSLLQSWLAGVYELRWRARVAAKRGRNSVGIP